MGEYFVTAGRVSNLSLVGQMKQSLVKDKLKSDEFGIFVMGDQFVTAGIVNNLRSEWQTKQRLVNNVLSSDGSVQYLIR